MKYRNRTHSDAVALFKKYIDKHGLVKDEEIDIRGISDGVFDCEYDGELYLLENDEWETQL